MRTPEERANNLASNGAIDNYGNHLEESIVSEIKGYADEYLKAFINWHNQQDYAVVNNYAIYFNKIAEFKESLKK